MLRETLSEQGYRIFVGTSAHPDLILLDTFGHAATDLAARYGGEEFVLLFAETALETAAALAESIRAQVEALRLPHPRSSTGECLTVSVGVASIVPTQFERIEQFFVAAHRMMYAAKEAGRNRVEIIAQGGQAWQSLRTLVMI
jgi:diguanylate cyclase (GGDEF)-like protein